jgi:hypothetical protein
VSASHKSSPERSGTPEANPELDMGAIQAPAIEFKSSVRVSVLPPVVDAARHVGGNFVSAVGPRHPKILWKAGFPSLGKFLGLAGDGTMYFGDDNQSLQLTSLYAVREGKQQWGYKFRVPNNISRALFAADGRVWVEQDYDSVESRNDQRFFVYNSRGEGGLTAMKHFPTLTYSSKIARYGWGKGGVSGWTIRQKQFEYKNCELGELTGIYTELGAIYPEKAWRLTIDGTCGAFEVNDDGDLITLTDAGTLYCVSPQGKVRWTQKAACQPDRLIALGSAGAVYPCASVLHAVRGGERQWTFMLKEEIDYSSVNVDAASTLYLLTKAPPSLLAIDKTGNLLWQLPFNSATPLGLDKSGRIYIQSGTALVCLSD